MAALLVDIEETSKVWKKSLRKHFGVASCCKWQQLYNDVICVLLELKPALLLDCLRPDAKKLQFLLQEVQSGGALPQSPNLIVVKVGEDVLLVNTQGNDCATWPSPTPLVKACCYVNITKDLESPTLISDKLAANLEQKLESWWSELGNEFQHQCSAKDVVTPIINSADSFHNVCTLFGKLLGYPAVYWFDPDQGYSLEMVNLICHTVTVRSRAKASPSGTKLPTMEQVHVHACAIYHSSMTQFHHAYTLLLFCITFPFQGTHPLFLHYS